MVEERRSEANFGGYQDLIDREWETEEEFL